MAKTLNPMEAYRREQKKRELKKHRMERQKHKQVKLISMDTVAIREQLRNFERQVKANPTDGFARKRKQELEDTLQAVVKKQKEVADEECRKQMGAPFRPQSMAQLTQTNKQKYQNPERSIYYDPIMNPFGAPPPGKPQIYRDMPSNPVIKAAQRSPLKQRWCHEPNEQRERNCEEGAGVDELSLSVSQQPRQRPGLRPPLPPGPPPPETIQVPSRPPFPSGVYLARPPPPPPAYSKTDDRMEGLPKPSQQPQSSGYQINEPDVASYNAGNLSIAPAQSTMEENAQDSIEAPNPSFFKSREDEDVKDLAAERANEKRTQLRSLVPVALRVQRHAHAPSNYRIPKVGNAHPFANPHPPARSPSASPPQPADSVAPASSELLYSDSVSKNFDAFMDEIKELI
ncbi:protein early flowering 5 [Plasmopara halstedii]|uniref:Protein early flowering 5 n=1 Tax=Plasmopara halstedii TaxID=4781 RepID=A0A0P1A8G4_PLAHL|nr:protein early flowering 5 [Plasmopara halstedii]CEG36340.1 protein early flowering 5 [Plasmopara halstedii]|eukprot:XP_024572709.1 protein early flowering 5 [Plasmopara halstedii]